jgi:TIR domain-containing protein
MPQYQDDIFISYRHLDNQSGWIDNFHERLRIRLTEFLGRPVRIWRDKKKLLGEYFADEIQDRIEGASVLISIVSPGYFDSGSEWCMKELVTFCRCADHNRGVRIGNKSRVVKVVKTPVSRKKYPEELKGSNDFQFYDLDPDNDWPLFFSEEPSGPLYQKYLSKLDDVALYVQRLLEEMDANALAEIVRPTPAPPDASKTVYLAETTSDLNDERDRIMRELRDRDYRVLPDEDLPRETPDYQDMVRKNLSEACLSVHLIGAKYGLIPDGEEYKSIVVLQNELAAERSADPSFTRLIWIPEGLQPKGERHQEFIKYLQTEPAAQKGAELLSRPFEALKTRIIEKLTNPKPPQPGPFDDHQLTSIYVVFDKLDFSDCRDKIRAVQKYLFDKGYEVILSAPESDDQSLSHYNKDKLIECDAALIYYGLANEFWLYSKLGEFKKAIGWGRAKPMLCKAIYRAEPETEHKQNLMTREAKLLEPPSYNSFSPQSLDTFIDLIENARIRFDRTGSEA